MTTAEVPTEIGWVHVTLPRLVAVVADTTADPDAHPDGIPVAGTVTFTPNLTAGTVVVASSGVGVLPQSKSFPLVDGSLDAYLIHPGDPDLNPNGWTYSVVLTVPGGAGVASTSIRGVLAVDAGVTDVNLLPLLPLSAASGGTITLTPGPQGDPGPAGEGVPAGGLTGQVLAKATETDFDTQWVTGGAGGGVTDHGALAGLDGDDHPQYHTDTRGDARYSQLGHTHTEYQPTGDYVVTTDPRLSDARTPTDHGHTPDDLGTGTPTAGQYLDGDGTWKALPSGGGGTTEAPGPGVTVSPVGWWFGPYEMGGSKTGKPATAVQWSYTVIPTEITVDQVGIQVVAAEAGAAAKLLLYSSRDSGLPDALVLSADLSLAAAGNVLATLAAPVILAPGLYWGTLVTNSGGTATVECANQPRPQMVADTFNRLRNGLGSTFNADQGTYAAPAGAIASYTWLATLPSNQSLIYGLRRSV